jgi:FAD synthase
MTENEILFLLINADRDIYDEEMVVSIIKKAITNKKLENPIGFLIKTLGIDMKNARFRDLMLTARKIDEELFRKKLEDKLVEGESAKKYMRVFWNEVVKPAYRKGLISKNTVDLLREPLGKAVYDDMDNVVYIPVPDEVYKEWFENNFLEELKNFLEEEFGISGVVVEALQQ